MAGDSQHADTARVLSLRPPKLLLAHKHKADRRANECGAPQTSAATLRTTAAHPKSALRNYKSVRPSLPSSADPDDG